MVRNNRVNGLLVRDSQFLISQECDDVEIGVGGGDTIVFQFKNEDSKTPPDRSVMFSVSADMHKLCIVFKNAMGRFSNRMPLPIGNTEDTKKPLFLNYCIESIGTGDHITYIVGYTLLEADR